MYGHVGQSTIHIQNRDLVKKMFFMYLMLLRISFLFASSHMITMLSLRFMLSIFFLGIGTRENLFFTEDVEMTFTLLPFTTLCSNNETIKMASLPSNRQWQGGTTG
jgi:hypothetical protein